MAAAAGGSRRPAAEVRARGGPGGAGAVPGTGHYVSMTRPPTVAAAAVRRRAGLPAVLAGLAAMALGLSACSGSSAAPGGSGGGGGGGGATAQPSAPADPGGPVQPAGKLSWHSCPGVTAAARCARLAVPLDYAKPGGRTISLALNEIPATARARRQRADPGPVRGQRAAQGRRVAVRHHRVRPARGG